MAVPIIESKIAEEIKIAEYKANYNQQALYVNLAANAMQDSIMHYAKSWIAHRSRNLRHSIAHSYLHAYHPQHIEDAAQHAWIGIERAITKYQPGYRKTFFTYAINWIRASVADYSREMGRIVTLPAHVVRAAYSESKKELPGVKKSSILHDLSIYNSFSLDSSDFIPPPSFKVHSEAPDPSQKYDSVDTVNYIQKLLEQHLQPPQLLAFTMRYGLNGDRIMTYREIGEYMNCSKQRVEQLCLASAKRMRRILEIKGYSLQDFLK